MIYIHVWGHSFITYAQIDLFICCSSVDPFPNCMYDVFTHIRMLKTQFSVAVTSQPVIAQLVERRTVVVKTLSDILRSLVRLRLAGFTYFVVLSNKKFT